MRHSIIQKLRATLERGVDSEESVVYLLAEIRKVLEQSPPNPVPFALKMYCHWALHVDLDAPGTTHAFLRMVDEFATSVLEGNSDLPGEHRTFREFVFLDTLRDQLREFLSTHGLPATLCDDGAAWHSFLEHYAGVIEDGSLSCRAKSQQFRNVKEVVFTKGHATPNSHVPFGLVWSIALLDGRTLRAELTSPIGNGRRMIGWHIRLEQ